MNIARTGLLLAAMTALFLVVGYLLGGRGGAMIALVIALGTNIFAWWSSDKMVLRMHNARPVTRASAPELYALVQELAQRAQLPMPAIYLIDTDQPNAFATGRDPHHSAVAVTRGLMQSLNRDELAGVIAHELAHIKNRDTLTMTIAATIAGAIGFLGQFAFFFGGSRDGERTNPLVGNPGDDLRAPGRDRGADGDLAHPRVLGRPAGGADLRHAAGAGQRAPADRADGDRADHALGRAQPGLGAHVHHQPAANGRGRQSVPHPSADGGPDQGAPGAGAGGWCGSGAGERQYPLRQRAARGWATRALGVTPGLTATPGLLKVAAAFPDPPFDVTDRPPTGFDIDLVQAVADELGLRCAFIGYDGDGFEGIFDGLADGRWDAVASGATVTERRRERARFCRPYVRSGQSLVANVARHPDLRSVRRSHPAIAGRAARQYVRVRSPAVAG